MHATVRTKPDRFRLPKDKEAPSPYVVPGIYAECSTVMAFVTAATGVSVAEIKSKSRKRKIVQARHIYCYISRHETKSPLKIIGEYINRGHQPTIHAIEKVAESLTIPNDLLGTLYKKIRGI